MRKSVYVAFALVLGSLLLWACNEKNDEGTPVPDHTAILSIRIGNTGAEASSVSTTSRAPITRAGLEDDIQTVDILSFKSDPLDPTNMMKGTFFYRARGTYQVQGSVGYVRVQLVGSAEPQTLVVLVNARKQVDALAATYGEQRVQVMKRLKLRADAGTGKVEMNTADGMPMWGELPAQTVNESYAQTAATAPSVSLERMVAKVTIKIGDEKLGECHYYYGYKAGQIAPDNTANTPTLDAADAFGNPADLSSSYVTLATGASIQNEMSFYLFESDNRAKAAANTMANSFITIKVTHNNYANGVWFRIDIKDFSDTFLDILRNRHYTVDLTNGHHIVAPGHGTEEEAIRGAVTFKCKIVPWYDVNEEVKVDELKRISTDKEGVTLKGIAAVTTGETLTVTTENTGDWQIDPTSIPAWVTVSPTSSTTDGPTTVTIKATQRLRRHSGELRLTCSNTITKLIKIK